MSNGMSWQKPQNFRNIKDVTERLKLLETLSEHAHDMTEKAEGLSTRVESLDRTVTQRTAAGELAGAAPRKGLGQANLGEQCAHATSQRRAGCDALHDQGCTATDWKTVRRGFSAACGFWKMICMSRRSGRSAVWPSA